MNLGALEEAFHRNFDEGLELGASVSVWREGTELLTLVGGYTSEAKEHLWTKSTLAPVFSATKGPSAATFLLSLSEAGMTLDTEVRRVWDNFPVAGTTFGEMISHQAGLPLLSKEVPIEDYNGVIRAIEREESQWKLGSQHGYHPRLVGFMQDECVRRITGTSLGTLWRERIAAPHEIDFWIGLPEREHHRVARLVQGKVRASQLQEGFYRELTRSGSLVNRAFRSPRGLQGALEMNKPSSWLASYPALGGVGSARSLAKFYQVTMGLLPDSPFDESLRQQISERRSNGKDAILMDHTSFGGGFMLDPVDEKGQKLRHLIGSDKSAYGHPGAGGSHGFADPSTGLSFAYVMNQMEVSVLPGKKVQSLLAALNLQ